MKQPNNPFLFIRNTADAIRAQRAEATKGPRSEGPTIGLDEVIAEARERGIGDGCKWAGHATSGEQKHEPAKPSPRAAPYRACGEFHRTVTFCADFPWYIKAL